MDKEIKARFLHWVKSVKANNKVFTLLSGKWGSGKTKLNIQLCDDIKGFWRFDVRQYNVSDSIIYHFLLVLAERYGVNVSDARISSFIHNSYPEDEVTMIKELKKKLAKSDELVFIDELDRISPYKALEVIEWVTNTFKDSQVTFVFSIYENALKDIISNEVGYCTPEEYIDDKIQEIFYIDDDISKQMEGLKKELKIEDYIWAPLKKDYLDNFSERTLNYLKDDVVNSIRINDKYEKEVFYNLLFMVKISSQAFSKNAVEHYAHNNFTENNRHWMSKIENLFELENKIFRDYSNKMVKQNLGSDLELIINEDKVESYVKFIEEINVIESKIEGIKLEEEVEINNVKKERDKAINNVKKEPETIKATLAQIRSGIEYGEKKLVSLEKKINNKKTQGLNATKMLTFMKSSDSYKQEYNDEVDNLKKLNAEFKKYKSKLESLDVDTQIKKLITTFNSKENQVVSKYEAIIEKELKSKNLILDKINKHNAKDIEDTINGAVKLYIEGKQLFNSEFKMDKINLKDPNEINVLIDSIHEDHVEQKQKYLRELEKHKNNLHDIYLDMKKDEYILI